MHDCRGSRQLIKDYALHAIMQQLATCTMYYTYAVGLKFIAACEGSPHNVLHSSSLDSKTITVCVGKSSPCTTSSVCDEYYFEVHV